MYYDLTKGSSPSFTIQTEHPEIIVDMLEQYTCSLCMTPKSEFLKKYPESDPCEADYCIPDNYQDLTIEEKLDILISTACGAEFSLMEYQDYEEFMEAQNGFDT